MEVIVDDLDIAYKALSKLSTDDRTFYGKYEEPASMTVLVKGVRDRVVISVDKASPTLIAVLETIYNVNKHRHRSQHGHSVECAYKVWKGVVVERHGRTPTLRICVDIWALMSEELRQQLSKVSQGSIQKFVVTGMREWENITWRIPGYCTGYDVVLDMPDSKVKKKDKDKDDDIQYFEQKPSTHNGKKK